MQQKTDKNNYLIEVLKLHPLSAALLFTRWRSIKRFRKKRVNQFMTCLKITTMNGVTMLSWR